VAGSLLYSTYFSPQSFPSPSLFFGFRQLFGLLLAGAIRTCPSEIPRLSGSPCFSFQDLPLVSDRWWACPMSSTGFSEGIYFVWRSTLPLLFSALFFCVFVVTVIVGRLKVAGPCSRNRLRGEIAVFSYLVAPTLPGPLSFPPHLFLPSLVQDLLMTYNESDYSNHFSPDLASYGADDNHFFPFS